MYPVYICIFLHESADDNTTTLLKIIEGILKKKNISTLNNYRSVNDSSQNYRNYLKKKNSLNNSMTFLKTTEDIRRKWSHLIKPLLRMIHF